MHTETDREKKRKKESSSCDIKAFIPTHSMSTHHQYLHSLRLQRTMKIHTLLCPLYEPKYFSQLRHRASAKYIFILLFHDEQSRPYLRDTIGTIGIPITDRRQLLDDEEMQIQTERRKTLLHTLPYKISIHTIHKERTRNYIR